MPVTIDSTPFALILNAVVTQVSTVLGVSTDFVRPVASDEYPVTETEDVFAYIRPFTPSPVDAKTGEPLGDQGAGRLAVNVSRRIRVYVWTRQATDTVGGDETALTGANPAQTVDTYTPPLQTAVVPGQILVEELVLNCLHNFTPVSGSAPLTLTPIHWIPSEGGPPLRQALDSEGLVWSALDFQAVYILSIDSVDPLIVAISPPPPPPPAGAGVYFGTPYWG